MRRFCLPTALALISALAACGDDPASPPVQAQNVTTTWEHPFPPTGIQDIWGAANNDIHAVGLRGELLHYDGVEWSLVESPTRELLTGIWGLSADNIVAVGINGTVIRFDGEHWAREASGTTNPLQDVWGSPDGILYAVGSDPTADDAATVLRFDGTSWELMPAPTPTSRFAQQIWGTSSDNFYVGTCCRLYRFDGSNWTAEANINLKTNAIAGSAPDDVWVADVSSSPLLHYDGVSWTRVSTGLTYVVQDLWALAKDNIFGCSTVGGVIHFDGAAWSEQSLGDIDSHDFYAVWASSANNAWVAGMSGPSSGLLYQFDGADWTRTGDALVPYGLNAIWSNESGDRAFAVGSVGSEGKILEKTGGVWRSVQDTSTWLRAVWGAPTGEVFVAGETVLQFDGAEWRESELATPAGFSSIWGTSQSNVYLGSYEGLWHFDGNEWTLTSLNDAVYSVWGTSASNVLVAGRYASGLGAVIRRFDGTSWKRIFFEPGLTKIVTEITGYGNGEMFATVFDVNGGYGTIQHFDGESWRDITPPSFNQILTLGANQDVGLIASGRHYDPHTVNEDKVLRYNGLQWEPLDPQYETSFVGAWGGLQGGIYMVGGSASIVRFEN